MQIKVFVYVVIHKYKKLCCKQPSNIKAHFALIRILSLLDHKLFNKNIYILHLIVA